MPESLPYTLILLSQSLLLAAAGIALARFERRCRNVEAFWANPETAKLLSGAESISHNADAAKIISVNTEQALLEKLKLDQRISELQRRLRTLSERGEEKTPSVAVEIERSLPIENALRMAKNGASVDELTRVCGLNVGEAQLLQRLHGQVQVPVN